jgi:pimeloyl-ACP methyl ester carboxylesterase
MQSAAHHPFRSKKAEGRYLERYAQRSLAWPVPSEERLVTTSFGETFVRVSGPSKGPPLLLLPGIGSPSLTFCRMIGSLCEQYTTYAIDNIHDNGRSVEIKPVKNAEDYSNWLDELCAGLGLESSLNLVGLSYGGWIFTHFAFRYPERVRKLVLLAPAGTVAPIPWGFIWRGLLCVIPARFLMHNFMNWIRVTEHVDQAASACLDEMADDAWVAQRCFKPRRMVAPIPPTDEEWKNLSVPTLILAGDREVIFDAKRCLPRMEALTPRIKTELMTGTGHDFFVVRAEEVSRHVLAFLG